MWGDEGLNLFATDEKFIQDLYAISDVAQRPEEETYKKTF